MKLCTSNGYLMINSICQTLRFFYSWNNIHVIAVRNRLFFTCHSITYKNLHHLSGTESNHALSDIHFSIIHSWTVFSYMYKCFSPPPGFLCHCSEPYSEAHLLHVFCSRNSAGSVAGANNQGCALTQSNLC